MTDNEIEEPMELASYKDQGTQVFALKGRLEFGDFPDSRDITGAIESGEETKIILDLTELDFIDSAGIGMLLGMNETAAEKGVTMAIRGAHGYVEELFNVFQLNTKFVME